MFVVTALVFGSRDARADFSFVHATDIHVTATTAPGSNAAKDMDRFREISALDPRPAFVFNTGDVCEIGTDAEYAVYRKVRESLAIPLHDAPGNHDVRWNPRGKEGYTKGTGQPLYHSFDHENVHFVVLDSTVLLQHWGHFDKAQLDWLAADLKKVGLERPVIIGFHHWIGRESVQVDNEEELLKVLAPYNVRLFLIGHGHSNIQWSVNGIPAIMAQGLYQGSYNLVKVTKDRLTVYRRTERNPTPTIEVLSEPLARQAVPSKQFKVNVTNGKGTLTLNGSYPVGSKAAFRMDSGKEEPMADGSGGGWSGTFDTGGLTPGTHLVTATVTTPEGRAYQTTARIEVSGPVAPLWRVKIGGGVQGKLAVANGTVYVPSMGNALVALDAKTGQEKWRFPTKDVVFSAPLVADGTVYFGSADHFIYAVDAATGKQRWKKETQGAVFAGAATAQGIVCIASVDRTIYGLDAKSGKVVWTAQGENMYQSQAATDGERFFVGGWDNWFRCLDAKTGKELWKQKFGKSKAGAFSFYYAPAIGSPTVGGGRVYVTSNDGLLHAMDTATGNVLFEIPGPSLGYSGPLLHDGSIFNASLTGTGQVFRFDAATGAKQWETPTGSVIYDSSCAFSGGNVYVGCVDGTFSALSVADGKIAWQYRLAPGHLLASPATDAERVYIGSLNGEVLAFPVGR
jgi:outer membrane protein assembly factor BamB